MARSDLDYPMSDDSGSESDTNTEISDESDTDREVDDFEIDESPQACPRTFELPVYLP
jgi:hypothetical protein